MDIKTKLQEEPLFLGKNSLFFQALNKKGIYTVEDYINADIEKMVKRKQIRAYQGILKYKYFGTPLIVDVLLDKEYSYISYDRENDNEIINDMRTLGFDNFWTEWGMHRMYDESHQIKLIDIIAKFPYKPSTSLKDFYINYYNTKIKNEADIEAEVVSDKDSLDSLKNELVSLLNQRNKLDTKISSLVQQINTLEGGKVVNGRK